MEYSERIRPDRVILYQQDAEVVIYKHEARGYIIFDTGNGVDERDLSEKELMEYALELSNKAISSLTWV